jgi:uncharacterized membrane protein
MTRRIIFLFILSMVPVIELRGAIPIGVGWGMPFWLVFWICVAGNIAVVPILVPLAGRVLLWGAALPKVGGFFKAIIGIGHKKTAVIKDSKVFLLALYLFVAIPAPGTGAWTGCLIATLLQLPLKKVFLPIAAGVLTAGAIMGIVSYGALGLLTAVAAI